MRALMFPVTSKSSARTAVENVTIRGLSFRNMRRTAVYLSTNADGVTVTDIIAAYSSSTLTTGNDRMIMIVGGVNSTFSDSYIAYSTSEGIHMQPSSEGKRKIPMVVYPEECTHCGICRLECPENCVSYKFPPMML